MIRLLVVIGLGTFGFGMADVLLEPYGRQALGLSVADTTKLTALFAMGTLIGIGIASRVAGQGGAPATLALIATLIGIATAGIVRDIVVGFQGTVGNTNVAPYLVVFMIEIIFLVAAAGVIMTMIRKLNPRHTDRAQAKPNVVEAS